MVNEWTRDDLPSAGGLAHTYAATSGGIIERFEVIVDEIVLRLNVRHPKGGCECGGLLSKAIDDLDRMRWARDTAVARAKSAERERDEAQERADKWHGAWQKSAPARTVTREDVTQAVRAATHYIERRPDEAGFVLTRQDRAVDAVCDLFGIEAEAVVDPVEEQAHAEADARYSGDHHHAFIEGALWVIRHVLGQEEP